LLRPGLKVLDAGCGTGAVTRAVLAGLTKRELLPAHFDGFDLTPQMLNRFWRSLERRPIPGIELVVADVLQLSALPASWRDYDLIVSSAMLEYLPKAAFLAALEGLRLRLRPGGTLVVFISRRSPFMVPLISRWRHANLYGRAELRESFREAGYAQVEFMAFPRPYGYLNGWGHVVSASY
jgi:SAM-dependent methyltransferase